MRRTWIFLAPLALLGMLLFIAIGGELVQQLWNWLLPPLFGWRRITFWQALGVLMLCRILFGGFGHHRFSPSNVPRRVMDRIADRMVDRMSARLDAMTPEEREQMRQRMRERFGFGPSANESKGQ